MADVLEIVDHDQDLGGLASLDGFTLRDGGHIRSEIVIQHDHIAPYCLDHASRRLVLADLPPELDLSSGPFPLVDQKVSARRLIAVPYDELPQLADRVSPPDKLVFVFNSARAGSTLLHQIFNEMDGMVSFSELDFFTNLVSIAHRADDRSRLTDLLRQCVRLFAYPFADQTVAFKFRSDCVDIADLFHAAFPAARNIFLYRNAIDWSASWWRMHLEAGGPEVIDITDLRADRAHRTGRTTHFDRVVHPAATTAPYYLAMLPIWLITIDAYLRHYERGVPFLALRYEDLDEHRDAMLAKVLDHVGLPRHGLAQALRGFEGDSQAGTALERKDGKPNQVTLNDSQVLTIVDILERQPTPLSPNVILPGTFLP